MSFLDSPSERRQRNVGSDQRRHRLVLYLIAAFSNAFPEITYELLWESATINAQAWRLGSKQYVRVYGGLARHATLTKAGLATALAHETGHHLAGAPCDPDRPWIAWQGQADYWATSTGLSKVFGAKGRALGLRGASEIHALQLEFVEQLGDEPDLVPECRYEVLRAGALGLPLPSCARLALAQLEAVKMKIG